MHAPHGADHVAPLLLALQRVARALQELDVPIAPDDHVQRAEGRGIHEEADVARVEPVVAAGDHDAGHAGRRRGGVGDGEPGAGRASHDVDGTPARARRPPGRAGSVVLLADARARRRPRPARATRRPRAARTIAARSTQRIDSARNSRSAAGKAGAEPVSSATSVVRRDADVQRPEAGRLLEEAHVVGAQVVQARLHDHGRPAGLVASRVRDPPSRAHRDARRSPAAAPRRPR